MDQVYEPPRRFSLLFTLGLGFLALLGALALLFLGSGNAGRAPNLRLMLLALPLLVIFIVLSCQAFLILTTRYLLDRSSLELHWGFQREIIPMDRVEWAHPVSDLDSPCLYPVFCCPGNTTASAPSADWERLRLLLRTNPIWSSFALTAAIL